MSLQVIGAGFGRTGTASLKIALEDLGFGPCHHMEEVLHNPAQSRMWARVARGEAPDWEDVFAGYRASCDFPSSVFATVLAERYPDARVVLTVREPGAWHRSAAESIYALHRALPRWCRWIPHVRRCHDVAERIVWGGSFDGRFEDEDHACRVFERHVERVRAQVPSDRLLVFRVQDGWEPLCRFLGVPVPDRPFPRVNERAAFQRRLAVVRALRWLPVVLAAAAGVVSLMAG